MLNISVCTFPEAAIRQLSAVESTAEKYVALYDFSPSGYFTLSPEGNISELNLAGSVLLGKDRSYLKNKRFSLFISDDSKPIFKQFIQRVFESNSKEYCEVRFTINQEPTIFVHIEGVFAETEKEYLLTVVDITDNEKTKEALKESENRFKRMSDDAPVLIWESGKDKLCNFFK